MNKNIPSHLQSLQCMVFVQYKAVQNMYEEKGPQLLENEEPIAMNQPLSFLFCREIAKHVHISPYLPPAQEELSAI